MKNYCYVVISPQTFFCDPDCYLDCQESCRKYRKTIGLSGPVVSKEYRDAYGRLHRLNGPAIDKWNGFKRWFYKGKYVNVKSQEQFEKFLKLKAFW